MGWLSRLKGRAIRDRVGRMNDAFVPRQWDEFFGGLAPDRRRAVASRVCREALAAASLNGEGVERARIALALGHVDSDLLQAIRSLVERLEGEYESLVGGDESKLSCADPVIDDAFVRARAATALRYALEGDLRRMVYEAWFVLDDLDEIRRLAGM
jgi:hypothetical protein